MTSVDAVTFDVDIQLEYLVVGSSNTTNAYYDESYSLVGNWSATIGDVIYFNISRISENDSRGDLKINDFIRKNESDDVIASNLALSAWPWMGGFYIEENWTDVESFIDANVSNTTITEESVNIPIKDFEITVTAKKISVNNLHGQESTFYYSKESKILVKASTSFGKYSLNIVLKNANLDEFKPSTNLIPLELDGFLIAGAIILLMCKKRK